MFQSMIGILCEQVQKNQFLHFYTSLPGYLIIKTMSTFWTHNTRSLPVLSTLVSWITTSFESGSEVPENLRNIRCMYSISLRSYMRFCLHPILLLYALRFRSTSLHTTLSYPTLTPCIFPNNLMLTSYNI